MTRVRLRVLPTVVALAVFASGGTSTSAGAPRPAESAPSNGGDTSSAPPTRPRGIRLDDIDPCTPLPQADNTDFDVSKPGKPGKDDRGAANCLWQGDSGYVGVTVVTYEGVEAQDGRHGEFTPTDPIDDFPAYTITLPDDDKACFVAVDVAAGQYLDVQVGLDFAPTDRPACDYAHEFASSVMSTLVQR